MGEPDASVHDRLDLSLADLKQRLVRGAADRRQSFHTPTVATIGLDGRPQLRTVVLRAFDPVAMTLRFHTDRRSAKVPELLRDPRIGLHVYDAGAKLQLRLEGRAVCDGEGPTADAAWAASRSISRACYAIMPGPGTAIAAPNGYALPDTEAQIAAGRRDFVAVTVTLDAVEWLHLAHRGHRRARFLRADGWAGQWLAP